MPSAESQKIRQAIQSRYRFLGPVMHERVRRLWAGSEALCLGRGGIAHVHAATGIARSTIESALRDLQSAPETALPPGRVRRPGGGRKPITESDPTLIAHLESLVEPTARGDPESPLRWTCKSLRQLWAELVRKGHPVSVETVRDLLRARGYRLQAPRKTDEGASHPDRDAQFAYVNAQTQAFGERGQPVVSVDAKKKERVGRFKNGGREWQPQGQPEAVRVYDFVDEELGRAIPYGVYDLTTNRGWVSVGSDQDTAEFAVATLTRWWGQMGKPLYPEATELLVLADGGGSNGSRNRRWKVALQRLATQSGLAVTVCHFPPGTSKWNKIEHRMFSFITLNWRGRPLVSHEVIVSLIGSTTTTTGLRIEAARDTNRYPTGIKVPDAELARVKLKRAEFHGDWNYTILPGQNESVVC